MRVITNVFCRYSLGLVSVVGLGASWYIPLTYLESISISLTVSLLASWRYIQAHGHLVALLDVRRSGHGLINDSSGDGLLSLALCSAAVESLPVSTAECESGFDQPHEHHLYRALLASATCDR